jgi:hypothetical protein
MPAILIETGFINNEADERYINSEKGQQELAESITAAVKRYRIALEGPGSPTPKTSLADNEPKETPVAEKYTSRTKQVLKKIDVQESNFKVDLYDDGDVDGDIVTVYYNGKVLINNKKLTEKPLTLSLATDPSKKENELIVYAENEGDIPPNTALMVVTDGDNRTEVRIAADSKKNGVIIFSRP